MMSTTKGERHAALRLDAKRVQLARDVFGEVDNGRRINSGCDDWPYPVYLTAEDRRSLVLDYCTWNGDPSEASDTRSLPFFAIHGYLTAALLKHAAESFK